MIFVSPTDGNISCDPYQYWEAETMIVDVADHSRVSELLGPDGEPLRVGYERHKLGFDLTPRVAT